MEENSSANMYLVAIMAIVAIVGLVALYLYVTAPIGDVYTTEDSESGFVTGAAGSSGAYEYIGKLRPVRKPTVARRTNMS